MVRKYQIVNLKLVPIDVHELGPAFLIGKSFTWTGSTLRTSCPYTVIRIMAKNKIIIKRTEFILMHFICITKYFADLVEYTKVISCFGEIIPKCIGKLIN